LWLAALICGGCNQKEPPERFDPEAEGLEPPFAPASDAAFDAHVSDAALDADVSDAALYGSCHVAEPAPTARAARVQINEVYAGSLIDEEDDWIELYNPGSTAVSLEGWVIEDRFTQDAPKEVPGRYELPAGAKLCARGFYVVARSKSCVEGEGFEFGLGTTDHVVLSDASGGVADEVEWRDLPHQQAIGRVEERSEVFSRLSQPTPGSSNSDACPCCAECLVGRCTLRDGACVAESEAQCLASVACGQLGWCALQGDRCVAGSTEHCTGSLLCKRQGRCDVRNGACTVATESGCLASKLCENEGRCGVGLDGSTCVAVSQADCEASDDCVRLDANTGELESKKNRCTLREGRCVATQCEDTTSCLEKMCCDLVDGRCVQR
jgi:hypothetical protein